MSLLLAFHDKTRAVVCSDDRAIKFDQAGEASALPERVPKFVCLRLASFALIFAALGRSDVCEKLFRGTARLVTAHPLLKVFELSRQLPGIFQKVFEERQPIDTRDMPLSVAAHYEAIECAILGFDHGAGKMRGFVFQSFSDDFAPVETTEDPWVRIFALGAYGAEEKPIFEQLTRRMKLAHQKQLPWVAAELRDTLAELHRRDPVRIGEPSFYAAFHGSGVVELPSDFPPTPAREQETATAAHRVTTVKETAFFGTTRSFLGSILTPKAGAPDTTGNNDGGTAAQYGMVNVLGFTNAVAGTASGTASITNPGNAIDGDKTTFAAVVANGNGHLNQITLTLSAPPGLTRSYESATLKILRSCSDTTSPSGNESVTVQYQVGGGAPTTIEGLHGSAALATVQVSLPLGINLSQISVSITPAVSASATSGKVEYDVYDAWIEATE